MINFRYHVVSLTAVFFALAIGLVVGTAALNGPAVDSLREQVTSLGEQNQQLRDQINHLTADVNAREEFTEQIAPVVLRGKLSNVRVLLLSTPSGADYVEGMHRMLTIAGAQISGQVSVTEAFTDPARSDQLLDLSHTARPASVAAVIPANGDGVEASAALLAAVLQRRALEVSEDDRRSVLSAYESQGYLSGTKTVSGAADLVVVVSGPPATDSEAPSRNAAVVTLVTQLQQDARVLVVANADAGAGNVVAEVRKHPQLSQAVSTVDNVATPQGRLVAAWAAADLAAGRVGHYGIGAGASLVPKPQ